MFSTREKPTSVNSSNAIISCRDPGSNLFNVSPHNRLKVIFLCWLRTCWMLIQQSLSGVIRSSSRHTTQLSPAFILSSQTASVPRFSQRVLVVAHPHVLGISILWHEQKHGNNLNVIQINHKNSFSQQFEQSTYLEQVIKWQILSFSLQNGLR